MRATGPDHAAREAKLEALQTKLTESVATLVTGEDWKRALEFSAKFRSRSFNNSMLIAVAHFEAHLEGRVPEPVPTYVAGFRQWQTLGRSVMKGQSGYPILAPVTSRYATSSPTEPGSWHRLARGEKPGAGESVQSKLVGLKPAYVWDISQTDGAPIPEAPAPVLLHGQAPVEEREHISGAGPKHPPEPGDLGQPGRYTRPIEVMRSAMICFPTCRSGCREAVIRRW